MSKHLSCFGFLSYNLIESPWLSIRVVEEGLLGPVKPKGTGSWKEVRRIRCTYVIKFCPQESWSIVMQSRQYPDKTRRSQVIVSCWMDVVQAPTRHIGSFKEEIDLNGKYQHPSLNSEFSCTWKGLETTKLDLAAHNLSDRFFRYINRSWNT